MSAPAFAWALERGEQLKLPPADRLVLIYLADMANGERFCWPSQERIVRFTGLALRTVRSAIHRLIERQLIRVEAAAGMVTKYHILRPATPANSLQAETHTPANGTGAPRQNVSPHPGKSCIEPRDDLPLTPANGAHDPSSTQVRDPKTRERAREEEEDLKTTEAGKSAPSGCDPGDAPVDPARFKALIGDLERSLRMRAYPQGQRAILDRDQQQAVVAPHRPKAAYLPPDILASQRRRAGVHPVPVS